MIFSPAPWFRIIFLFISAVIIFGIITLAADNGGGFTIPIIIAAVCIIASLYEESWIFDRDERIIISKTGLLFLFRRRVYSFSETENLEFFIFLRGAESDGSADHEINLTKPFSKENTAEAAGSGPKIIHPKYHQEIRLSFKSGSRISIESLDSRSTDNLKNKAEIISEFCGIPLVK